MKTHHVSKSVVQFVPQSLYCCLSSVPHMVPYMHIENVPLFFVLANHIENVPKYLNFSSTITPHGDVV